MGLGTYLNDKLFGDQEAKKQRETQAPDFAQKLLTMGIDDPTTVNEVTRKWVDTGAIDLPSVTSKRAVTAPGYDMPNPEGGVPISVLPETTVETAPLRLGKRTVTADQAGALGFSGDVARLGKAFPEGIPQDLIDHAIRFSESKNMRDLGLASKEGNEQDKLEQNFRQGILSVRGDSSLKRLEEQRDAAITAYNRINEVKSQGDVLNPIDYVDILGQIYKARTGSAPTNEVLSDAKQQTAKGKFGKVYTYFTGQQAPATTQDIMDSLQEMSASMGMQADRLHDAYMKPHMLAPSSLSRDRADRIMKEGRGLTFQEATGYAPGAQSSGRPDKTGYVIGQKYKMKDGNMATYLGNGEFE